MNKLQKKEINQLMSDYIEIEKQIGAILFPYLARVSKIEDDVCGKSTGIAEINEGFEGLLLDHLNKFEIFFAISKSIMDLSYMIQQNELESAEETLRKIKEVYDLLPEPMNRLFKNAQKLISDKKNIRTNFDLLELETDGLEN